MADFQQRGPIATLPRLVVKDWARRERELVAYAKNKPVAVLIPCLAKEMESDSLGRICRELNEVAFVDLVVISLDQASSAEFRQAQEYFSRMRHATALVWTDNPQLTGLLSQVEESVGRKLTRGKGKAVWLGLGFLLAQSKAYTIALHDADILTYSRDLLANLVTPLLHPSLEFDFVKAYYSRFSSALYGRVTRLFIRPLLQALGNVVGRHPYLSYLAAFRYPLAGEVAMIMSLARWIRIPGDWGLEVGVLFEILRHRSPRRICQVDVADQFDHKHQELSPTDATQGLHRMAVDIAKHLLRTFSAAGVVLNEGAFKSMRVAYQRYAEDAVSDSFAVATFNGLAYDRHGEELAVETFAKALAEGIEEFLADPLGTPPLPHWERVVSALPSVPGELTKIVEESGGLLYQ